MGREHDPSTFRDFSGVIDEDGPAFGQGLDDMPVVHDLLADIDRCAEVLKGAFDGDHGTIYAGTVAARCGQQHPLVSIDRSADLARCQTPARNGRGRY